MSKHTPGPWHVVSETLGSVESACGIQVANAQATKPVRKSSDHDERKANARLIAASPDLLDALRHVEQRVVMDERDRAIVSAAIAKATGDA